MDRWGEAMGTTYDDGALHSSAIPPPRGNVGPVSSQLHNRQSPRPSSDTVILVKSKCVLLPWAYPRPGQLMLPPLRYLRQKTLRLDLDQCSPLRTASC